LTPDQAFLFWGAGVFVLPITKVDPNAEYH
jgi:hypothetical protein